MSTNTTTYPKGSIGNPYTYDEYESMVEAGTWNGGFVAIDETTYVFYKKNKHDKDENGTGSGSGSGSSSGSDFEGSSESSSSGSGSGSGSGFQIPPVPSGEDGSPLFTVTGSDFGSRLDNGNASFFQCLAYVDSNKFHRGFTSEQYRLDYLSGIYSSSWKGSGRQEEYFNGPYTMESENTPNREIIDYIQTIFLCNDGLVQNIDTVRGYFSTDGECHDGIVIGVFRSNTNADDMQAHAVIIQSSNRGNLNIYDPQLGESKSQDYWNGRYDDSNFLYAIKITGLA